MSYSYEEERENALFQESMSQGAYNQAAIRQWAWEYGKECPEHAWLNSPFDSWEKNPHYQGPAVRHPEDDRWDDEDPSPEIAAEAEDDSPFD